MGSRNYRDGTLPRKWRRHSWIINATKQANESAVAPVTKKKAYPGASTSVPSITLYFCLSLFPSTLTVLFDVNFSELFLGLLTLFSSDSYATFIYSDHSNGFFDVHYMIHILVDRIIFFNVISFCYKYYITLLDYTRNSWKSWVRPTYTARSEGNIRAAFSNIVLRWKLPSSRKDRSDNTSPRRMTTIYIANSQCAP